MFCLYCSNFRLAINGRSEEALRLFEQMKGEGITPDSVSYIAVLCACSHMGWVKKGFCYFNSMLDEHGIKPELDHYACMVDLLGVQVCWRKRKESNKGDDAEEVRRTMRRRRIKRVPGCSSIEVDGVVHEFVAGDRDRGVLFDVEEEEKEAVIGYHSEKLALAFGFICTEPGSMLRIVKNIRICNDCHSAIKLVSMVFNRKIAVRDRKRFHHLKEGLVPAWITGEHTTNVKQNIWRITFLIGRERRKEFQERKKE
ncbi:hypothetical protein HHK36_032476 [Tetracentron sinense]|uniref:DYW domain-containing protein n=1 Tax=Tetracentron sinense TaxID=13715 RepID=A0A834Y946_TETSI|nr:hypothetical protein HHK36_032476 [Tetracentron sinense]